MSKAATALSNHIAPELLRHFGNGRLSMAGTELVLRHLAVCDVCLERANVFWLTEPENGAAAFPKEISQHLVKAVLAEIERSKRRTDSFS